MKMITLALVMSTAQAKKNMKFNTRSKTAKKSWPVKQFSGIMYE
jgi:hypothetical protein